MLKKYVVIVICICFVHNVFSQNDFREGFIINNENDTIYGLIEYKTSRFNAKKCIFKHDENADVIKYTPEQIQSYRFINGKYYISKSVNDNEKLVFLEYIINGIVDIYYYRDEKGEYYYIDNEETTMLPLRNNEKEFYVNGVKYKKRSTEYKQVLKHVFSDSPKISKKAEFTPLNHKSIIKIAHDYHMNVCEGEECIIYEKKYNKSLLYGSVIGVNMLNIHVHKSDINYEFLRESDFGNIIYPVLGFFVKNTFSEFNDKIAFQYEFSVSKFKINTVNIYGRPDLYLEKYDLSISYLVFDNAAILRYSMPIEKLNPIFSLGAFLSIPLKTNYEHSLEQNYIVGGVIRNFTVKDVFTESVDPGFIVGLGTEQAINEKRKVFVDVRYKLGFGLLQDAFTNYYEFKIGVAI